ncbi:hypothetical protein BN77_p11101 [Rhizobium mesoamericanum STM3625]|uniref:Uncharacterized protein n=1 Tax=Rhizobium mesoamericanum STM3625 TaxID=1211777 RepID=K0Q224_9HYPH|nr:hypothetical protein BN77_p11101 [Rhizobium mesoamericanum STM3625]
MTYLFVRWADGSIPFKSKRLKGRNVNAAGWPNLDQYWRELIAVAQTDIPTFPPQNRNSLVDGSNLFNCPRH